MRLKIIFLIILLGGSFTLLAQRNENAIRQLLSKQTECWNKGDIEGFMQTYWQSDSLLYVGKSGVTYGWHRTLERYKKSYPDRAAMGTLQFTIIKVQQLSSKMYNVVGKWQLTRVSGNVEGHYTLLLRKINGKWLIVQDHSS
ncbi:hypothetical protein PIECOFPK_00650 [Mycovorax composti]|jgi:hypothetical protein|uniref:DUF4440 domain-containing protein n=2 Tax=Chitinophagaceae TaxID=563835 RepID=A0ABZ2EHR3_9BACT